MFCTRISSRASPILPKIQDQADQGKRIIQVRPPPSCTGRNGNGMGQDRAGAVQAVGVCSRARTEPGQQAPP
ncbi:MAG TPA: hypothetical protein ENN39_10105, partial [Desulfonatronum sp.]|nr:hypothetical protein [Desulfonatronum sp.]